MPKPKEITFELTNYCPHGCKYCSSDATSNRFKAKFIETNDIIEYLEKHGPFDRIILSGGEPLAHPNFYFIMELCEDYCKEIVVYSNTIKHLVYNANVIDGVYVEANLTVPDNTKKIHVLKRIEQGREKTRPEVKFSRNYIEDCECEDRVMLPTGELTYRPCDKRVIE